VLFTFFNEPANGGQLVQFCSAIPLDIPSTRTNSERFNVAVWKPSSHVPSHKFITQAGRSVLTTNCTLGFQGKHNYCQGMCKFIQAVVAGDGDGGGGGGGGSMTVVRVLLYLVQGP
jgi:hypothetical protein